MSHEPDSLSHQKSTPSRPGVIGRYAPSPTGPLHLGNLRTALIAWLQARLNGGRFILRMEDLDQPRVKPGCAAQVLADLHWLGLDWDEGPDVGGPNASYDQSQRLTCYEEAFQRLRREGRLFPCYCSRKDIAQAASAPHRDGMGPVYPGTCRGRVLHARSAEALRINGRRPSWRYRVSSKVIRFEDCIVGSFAQNLAEEVGDFVLHRADGLFAYQLAVVVDDALMGITDVVRGEDLLDSTPRQLELFEALGFPAPRFWHVPLVCDERGQRLAKRDGSDSVTSFRERGITSASLVGSMAASLGLAPRGAVLTPRELCDQLDRHTFRAKLSQTSAHA